MVLDGGRNGNELIDAVVDTGENILAIVGILEGGAVEVVVAGHTTVVAAEEVEFRIDFAYGIYRETGGVIARDIVTCEAHIVLGTDAEVAVVVAGEEVDVFTGDEVEGSVGEGATAEAEGVGVVGLDVAIDTDVEVLDGADIEAEAIEIMVVELDFAETFTVEHAEVSAEPWGDIILEVEAEVGGVAIAIEVVHGAGDVAQAPVFLGEDGL